MRGGKKEAADSEGDVEVSSQQVNPAGNEEIDTSSGVHLCQSRRSDLRIDFSDY